jgi:hypothetical protein
MSRAMDAMIGPDGQPPVFDGAAWVSADRRYWWNGAAWQPIKRHTGFHPPFALIGIFLVLIAGAWFLFTRVLPSVPANIVVMGVTHAKIDSSTQVELDYARASECKDLTFQFVFYDKANHDVGEYVSDDHKYVSGGDSHHYTFYTFQAIPSTAVRFDAIANCHD